MKFITYQDYLICSKMLQNMGVREESERYNLENTEEIDRKHDKMFRDLLSRKKEMAKLINQFLGIKEKIIEKDLIQCHTDHVTKYYENRQSDVIYKLKNRQIYFLVEHQSSVDIDMAGRRFSYVNEIMREEVNNIPLKKDKVYPIVIPIVIYTGFRKWNAELDFANRQYQSEIYREYLIHLQYNLIDIKNYSYEELLDKKSLIASAMILEKCKIAEELEEQTYKIIDIFNETDEKEKLKEIIINFVAPSIGKEKARQMIEKINGKEEKGMSPLTKMLGEMQEKAIREGREEGMKQGMEQGMKQGMEKGERTGKLQGKIEAMISAAKKMLKGGEEDEKIIQYTGISRQKIEELKKEIQKEQIAWTIITLKRLPLEISEVTFSWYI